jgi:N-acetylmuramoyl-L-alanine amidase
MGSRICLAILCTLCLEGFVSAAPPPRTMYADALAREQTVRAAMAAPDATAAVLADVHAVIATFESLVRRYPASGYSDNALWEAGRLALDAFLRFGETADRDAGVKLLRRLATGYPSSTLVAQIPAQLAVLDAEESAPLPVASKAAARSASPEAARPAPGAERIATIRDIKRTVLGDAVRVTIELDGEVPFHDERIADPDRVFVDFPRTRPTAALADKTLRFASDADVVRQVRVGRHPNSTTRVVLDAGGVASYSIYPLYDPYRLVIDCVRAAAPRLAEAARVPAADEKPIAPKPAPPKLTEPKAAELRPPDPRPIDPRTFGTKAIDPKPLERATAPRPIEARPMETRQVPLLQSRSLTAGWTRRFPNGRPVNREAIARASSPGETATTGVVATLPPVPPPPAAPLPSSPLPTAATTGGLSIARQLGLGVSRIVIDPGHGGHDPGAKGKGVTEAELVLDIALRVEKLLAEVPGVDVILTRRTDDFVPLPERTAIANREGADLFLSIHANASPNAMAHGIETYFLNFATNTSAAAVAARENAASTLAMGEMPDIVKAIALNNKVDESRDFASHVQRAMLERLRTTNKTLKDLGVKQAPFVVLIGATMPSVLAEISFVTNPQEARLLKGSAYRQKIAESLFTAIRKYQTSLKGATAIALQ